VCPLQHIFNICFTPRDDGPAQIPNIKDAVDGGRVGIGANEWSGSGTLRWDGRGGPQSVAFNMMVNISQRGLPVGKMINEEICIAFYGFRAAPVAITKPPHASVDFCECIINFNEVVVTRAVMRGRLASSTYITAARTRICWV
jgi:hypothetical protein